MLIFIRVTRLCPFNNNLTTRHVSFHDSLLNKVLMVEYNPLLKMATRAINVSGADSAFRHQRFWNAWGVWVVLLTDNGNITKRCGLDHCELRLMCTLNDGNAEERLSGGASVCKLGSGRLLWERFVATPQSTAQVKAVLLILRQIDLWFAVVHAVCVVLTCAVPWRRQIIGSN